jgi:predicted alpha/beta-hydrolase family hydrolase
MRLLFAHGAGAGQDSDFIRFLSQCIEKEGIDVIRFNFPYMDEIQRTGKRRPPNQTRELIDCWHKTIGLYGSEEFFIGGKSMGGRIASLVANQCSAKGLICAGFPFHAPGRPNNPQRLASLLAVSVPTLLVQGTRDGMGSLEDLESIPWPHQFQIEWLIDGDHSFKPRKASGWTQEGHLRSAARAMVQFMRSHSP